MRGEIDSWSYVKKVLHIGQPIPHGDHQIFGELSSNPQSEIPVGRVKEDHCLLINTLESQKSR